MILALHIACLFLGLFLTQEFFRRFPKVTLVLFIILPFLLTPYWIENGVTGWFLWAKMFSVVAGVVWFSIFRLTSFGETNFAKTGIYLILVINIIEALFKDILGGFLDGGVAHYLNAAAGILLIVTLNKINSINTSKKKYLDVNWDGMTLMWIIGYTIWNWTFVYLNLVQFSAENLAVLGVPLIIAFFDKGRWLQTRAFTLSTYLIFFYSLRHMYPKVYSYYWANEFYGYCLAEMSLIFMIVYAIVFLRARNRERVIKIA